MSENYVLPGLGYLYHGRVRLMSQERRQTNDAVLVEYLDNSSVYEYLKASDCLDEDSRTFR